MPIVRKRSALSVLAVAALTLGLLPAAAAPAAAATVIAVEGESPSSSNMSPGPTAQTGASGGSSMRLYTGTAAPTGGYVASYTVTAPSAGVFALEATTIPLGVDWASPFSYRINSGAWRSTSGAQQLAVVTSELRTYSLGTVGLVAGTNTVSFRVDQRRAQPNTNYTLFLDRFTLTEVPLAVTSVQGPERFGVFEHGNAASLVITLNAEVPADVSVPWTVTDYWGTTAASGTATVATGTASATVSLGSSLPTGAYHVQASAPGQTSPTAGAFAVLPDLASRPTVEDSPFAVDVYGAKLIATADATAFADVLELTGVEWIRDRTRWNDTINPSLGTISFASETQPHAWLEAADAVGLKTLSSYHGAPSWTTTTTRKLPQDLRAAYQYAVAAGTEYDGLVHAWQLWNEQNRGFALAAEGADRYASVTKAAALGFLDSGTDAELVGGGLAGVDPHYAQWQFRNGILDYLDAYAYHTHTTANAAAATTAHPDFASQLDAARPFGGDAKERWVTESGVALNTLDATSMPSAGQETLQARYIVSSAAESLAGGTSRQFFFIAAPYREGLSFWSAYRTPDEPMSALAAQSVMTKVLGQGEYLGRVSGMPTGASAYAFGTGSGQAAVLWAPTATTVSVPITGASAVLTDLMGGTQTVTASGSSVSVAIGPDPVYVSASAIGGVVDGPAAVTPAPRVQASDFSEAERVVLQQIYSDGASANAQTDGYGLSTSTGNALTVEVYNFNDHSVTANVSASVGDGWQISGGTPSVTVAAGDRATVSFTVSATTTIAESPTDLSVVATVDGQPSSPSVAEVRPLTPSVTTTHIVDGSDDRVRARYTNTTGASRQITGTTWTIDGVTQTASHSITVAAGASVTLDSPAVAAGAGEVAYSVAIDFSGGGRHTAGGTVSALPWGDVPQLAERTITVDGTLDNLTGVPAQQLSAPGADPADIAATAWFTWDDDDLYLSALVTDDVHAQPHTGNATWKADGLQFAASPDWPGETAQRPEVQPRMEFGLALTPAGAQLYRFASPGASGAPVTGTPFAVVRDDVTHTTSYEVAIPWSALAPIGVTPTSAASLSVSANDADADGIRGWVSWGEGITTNKDTSLFRPVLMEVSP